MTSDSTTRKRVHPLFWDLGLTFVANTSSFIANLAIVSIIGRWLGPALLAEYLLVRRVIGWMTAGQLGLGVGLPRYVAHAVDDREGKQENYFLAGLACIVVLGSALLIPLLAAPSVFSRLLFGDLHLKRLIVPLSVFMAGMMIHGVVYGYYRGRLKMGMANSIQVCNFALGPLISVLALFRTHSVGTIVTATGVLMIAISSLFAIPIFRSLTLEGSRHIPQLARELMSYGLPRLPGDFSGGALYALGPVIAAHYFPLPEISYLLLGISILMAVGVSTAPLGMILLSKVSMMLAQDRLDEVRSHVQYLMAAVLELSSFLTLQIVVFADVLVQIWVGHAFTSHTAVIRLTVTAVPFYLLYTSLRSHIDAATVKAYTARINLSSLAVFVAVIGLEALLLPHRWMLEGIAAALLAAMITMSGVTAYTVQKLYAVTIPWKTSAPSLLCSLLLGAAAYLIRWRTGFQTGTLEFVIIEAVMALAYISALRWLRSSWVQYFWNRAILPAPVAMAPLAN